MDDADEYASNALAADSLRASPLWNSARYLGGVVVVVVVVVIIIPPMVVPLHLIVKDFSFFTVRVWD